MIYLCAVTRFVLFNYTKKSMLKKYCFEVKKTLTINYYNMAVIITPEKLKEIATEIDMGMKCFYHVPTGALISYPDEMQSHGGFEKDMWKNEMKAVKSARKEYIAFEAMESSQSFRIIENFIYNIEDDDIRGEFENAVARKKPFQQFKYLLLDYPELREQWFKFKDEKNIEWVKEQLDDSAL